MRKWLVKFISVKDGSDFDVLREVEANSIRDAIETVEDYCASLWSTCDVYYIEEIK